MCFFHKVTELEHFYKRQSTEIVKQRLEAMSCLKASVVETECLEQEMKQLNGYFDQQHEHMVHRISRSLQLLKEALPRSQSTSQATGIVLNIFTNAVA